MCLFITANMRWICWCEILHSRYRFCGVFTKALPRYRILRNRDCELPSFRWWEYVSNNSGLIRPSCRVWRDVTYASLRKLPSSSSIILQGKSTRGLRLQVLLEIRFSVRKVPEQDCFSIEGESPASVALTLSSGGTRCGLGSIAPANSSLSLHREAYWSRSGR